MKTMKIWRLAFAMIAVFTTLAAQAQLFHPLGLDFNGGERQGDSSQPRMHVEGDRLSFIKAWFVDPLNKTGCRFLLVDS